MTSKQPRRLSDADLQRLLTRVQRRGDDSVVKLRPVIPDNLPAGLRKSKDLVVEVDAMPGG